MAQPEPDANEKLGMSLDEISAPAPKPEGEAPVYTEGYVDPSQRAPSSHKVFVANLAYMTTWQTLKDVFGQVGPVNYAKLMQEPSGRSKGCGIIEFTNAEDSVKAIERLNETMIDGRSIVVREDQGATSANKRPRQDGYGGGGYNQQLQQPGFQSDGAGQVYGQGMSTIPVGPRVYVSNLSFETPWQEVKDYFRNVGNVLRVDLPLDPNGRSRGFAVVEMSSAGEALEAISKLSNTSLDGRNISVRVDQR